MRTIPDPGFRGDDGSAPAGLTAALEAYDADPDAGYLSALAALCEARLLVPVLAILGELEEPAADGLPREKSSDMAAETDAALLQHPARLRGLQREKSSDMAAETDAALLQHPARLRGLQREKSSDMAAETDAALLQHPARLRGLQREKSSDMAAETDAALLQHPARLRGLQREKSSDMAAETDAALLQHPARLRGLQREKSSDMAAETDAALLQHPARLRGLQREKSSDMAAVLLKRPDGRSALLAFTSTTALTGWNPEGRPVPVPASTAALSATQDGATALLVDVAGPVRFVVEGEDLVALARGWRLVALEGGGWGWLTEGTG